MHEGEERAGVSAVGAKLAAAGIGVAILGVALAWAPSAHADCIQRNVLSDAASAAAVVVVRVQSVTPTASAQVQTTVKGQPGRTVALQQPGGEDDDIYERGHRYLLFLDASGHVLGPCATRDLSPGALRAGHDTEASLVATLRRWVAARDDVARRQVLLGAALGRPALLGQAAAELLAASPTLVAALTEPERARIVSALGTLRDERLYGLAWIVARLHRADAIAPLAGAIAAPGPSLNSRPLEEALEVLANHHDDSYRAGEDLDGPTAHAIADRWRALAAAARDATWLTRRFPERAVRTVPRLDDARVLAAFIRDERTDRLSRVVALTFCEPLAGVAESDISHLYSPATSRSEWAARAAACERTGVTH